MDWIGAVLLELSHYAETTFFSKFEMGLLPPLTPLDDHLEIWKQVHYVSQLNLHTWCEFHLDWR